MSEPKLQGKSHDIPKKLVWSAWLKVKENGGAAGVDGVTIGQFEERLKDNLYRLWNRMSSGSYFPGPVRAVEIPKKGGTRVLGIPNVVDRVAQTVAVLALEPEVEKVFSRRLLRISSRTVTLGRDSGMPQAVLGEGLGRRPRREGLLRHGLMGSDNEGGHGPYGPEMGPALCRALA
jgi:hypothetical protein